MITDAWLREQVSECLGDYTVEHRQRDRLAQAARRASKSADAIAELAADTLSPIADLERHRRSLVAALKQADKYLDKWADARARAALRAEARDNS